MKAAGTSSDTYTTDNLRNVAVSGLKGAKTLNEIQLSVRDRAMLLLSAALAFRGNSARMVLWSDLFTRNVPMPELGVGRTVQVLGILADNAKTNKDGRVDEHGALRHRMVDLCPVGAIALHLFVHFHIKSNPPPDFAPDFNDKAFGEFGRRTWYKYHVFWGKDMETEMSYDSTYIRLRFDSP